MLSLSSIRRASNTVGLRSATTVQSYDPGQAKSAFGQFVKNRASRSGFHSNIDAATEGDGVEEYEEDLLATGDIQEINRRLNAAFREGLAWERVGRYDKMSSCYQRLFTLFFKYCRKLDVPLMKQGYGALFYELHAHYGVALSHVGEYKKAAREFTKAVEAVSTPKGTCRAGCKTLSCLHPPLFAKRAIANALTGSKKQALNDANRACMLDSKNPDVYCIRALVKGTINKAVYIDEILSDLDRVLEMNSHHVPGLVLRSSFDPAEREQRLFAWKACRRNPDAQVFIPLTDLGHPDINRFMDRYFHALSIPHSILEIRVDCSLLKPTANRLRRQMSASAGSPGSGGGGGGGGDGGRISVASQGGATSRPPFRCGTPGQKTNDGFKFLRRKEYSRALKRETELAEMQGVVPKESTGGSISDILGIEEDRMIPINSKCSGKMWANLRYATEKKWGEERKPQDSAQLKAFEPVLASSSRMYCRPWAGDQIPTIEVRPKPDHVVPFVV